MDEAVKSKLCGSVNPLVNTQHCRKIAGHEGNHKSWANKLGAGKFNEWTT